MSRVFQGDAIAYQWSNSWMALKLIEQIVGLDSLRRQRGYLGYNTNGERVTIGIEKAAAFDRTRGKAHIFVGHPFVPIEIEALLDGVGIEAQDLFDAQRHLIGTQFMLQASLLR